MPSVVARDVRTDVPCEAVCCLKGHDGPIQAVCFTDDGGKYCLTGGHDRTVRLWNPTRIDTAYSNSISEDNNEDGSASVSIIPTSKRKKAPATSTQPNIPPALPIQSYSHSHPVAAVAAGAQNNRLLAASSKNVIVTDLISKKVLHRYTGHEGRVNDVALLNDDLYVSASYDGTVRLWDGRDRSKYTPLQTLREAKDSVTKVSVPRRLHQRDNSPRLCTASVDGTVRVYDIRKGVLVCFDLGNPVIGLDVSSDEPLIAASCLDGTVRLLEKKDSSGGIDNQQNTQSCLLKTYSGTHVAGQYALDCALTDRYVWTGSEDGSCVAYDVLTTKPIQTLAGNDRSKPVCAIAVRPKDSVVVTCSYNGEGLVWTPRG